MRGLAGLLLVAGVAAGQAPPVEPAAATLQPGSVGWPTTSSPTVPPPAPSGVAVPETRSPGQPLPQYRPPVGYPPESPLYVSPGDLGYPRPPLPGSLADEFGREYAERQRLRSCDYLGNVYTTFPTSLLWEPPLADKRSPRLAAAYADQESVSGTAFDGSFGQTLGLFRVDRNGLDGAAQLDVFAAAFGRFDGSDLVVADFRGGIPLTFRRGDYVGKLAYEHTSSFLGDGVGPAFRPFPRPRYQKDEIVLSVGRWFAEDRVRVYGTAAYAFGFIDDNRFLFSTGDGRFTDDDQRRQRYQLGAEWFPWGQCNGRSGQPFAAIHADFRGENDFNGDVTAQAGWLWRNPYQRLASVRVYAEYFSGRSLYGQFSRADRDNFAGFGIAADY